MALALTAAAAGPAAAAGAAAARRRPLQHRRSCCRRAPLVLVRAAGSQDDGDAGPPPGCSRYTVKLKKPLGLVLQQQGEAGPITVAELKAEGAAERAGVGVGDQLIACSGVTYGRLDDYGGVAVKKDMKLVRMSAIGQTFKAVSAAIGSHPGHMEVTLELQRCGGAQ